MSKSNRETMANEAEELAWLDADDQYTYWANRHLLNSAAYSAVIWC